jgi:hypothetical protein
MPETSDRRLRFRDVVCSLERIAKTQAAFAPFAHGGRLHLDVKRGEPYVPHRSYQWVGSCRILVLMGAARLADVEHDGARRRDRRPSPCGGTA